MFAFHLQPRLSSCLLIPSRLLFSCFIPTPSAILGSAPDGSTNQSLLSLIDQCQSFEELKQLHARTIVTGLIHEHLCVSKVLNLCTRLGDLDHGLSVLDRIHRVHMLTCNTVMRGYASSSSPWLAVEFYKELVRRGISPDSYTLPLVIKVCAQLLLLQEGREFHTHVVKFGYEQNIYVQNRLIHMYAEFGEMNTCRQVFDATVVIDVASWTSLMHGYVSCGDFCSARQVFDEMPERNEVTWTTMMHCWTHNGQPGIAVNAFYEMKVAGLEIDGAAVVALVAACARLKDVRILNWVHGVVQNFGLEDDVFVSTALVDMFAKYHSIDVARAIFDSMSNRNAVSWNVIIGCYAELGQLDISCQMFNQMPYKNVVTWNTLIAGCIHCGCFQQALDVFRDMILWYDGPDQVTLVTLISAIVKSRDLESGKQVHGFVYRSRIHLSVTLGNALIDMYAKCGCMEKARLLFDSMPETNIISWNTLLIGLAMHGYSNMALDLFENMQSCLVKANEVTFVALLSAFSRSGMVKEGYWYFERMSSVYNVEPKVVHYTCMVDLLGRAGFVEDAFRLVKDIPVKPDAVLWGALLGACSAHSNFNLGEIVGRTLLDVEPEDGATYVTLSNIFASENRWVDVKNIRDLMNDKGVKKSHGCSILNLNS